MWPSKRTECRVFAYLDASFEFKEAVWFCGKVIAGPKAIIDGRRRGLWHEYQIPANSENQKKTIRSLRKWIQNLEKRKLVAGYAFNYYCSNPNEPDELRVRFQYSDERNRETVESELEREVKKVLPDYVKKERIWDSSEHIQQAYEFGTRCAFLAWDLIESQRFPRDYFSNFFMGENDKEFLAMKIPFEFQEHLNHGIMNSLGVLEYPSEALIHSSILWKILAQVKRVKNRQELTDWMAKNLSLQ